MKWRSITFLAYHRPATYRMRSEEHTSELQSHSDLVCRLLLEKKKKTTIASHPVPTNRRLLERNRTQSDSRSCMTSLLALPANTAEIDCHQEPSASIMHITQRT